MAEHVEQEGMDGAKQPPHAGGRHAPLRLTPREFRDAGHELVDTIAAFLDSVRDRRVTPNSSVDEVQRLIDAGAPLPTDGRAAASILRETASLLCDNSLLNGHPRFFGYITSSPAPIGILADLLAAAVNANVGAWQLSPVATEIEAQTVRWIAELLGYPTTCGGLMVSGGNMANMTALWAARAAAQPAVRTDGVAPLSSAGALRVYASAETHTWLQKGTDLAGLGTNAVRWIATDARQRMDVALLREALARDVAAGDRPMMVVATAGSVSTGAIDPLRAIADCCREVGAWLHVDGAYGAFAACLPDAPDELRALALADSVAVDPHKWLYAPLEAGCVLVRDEGLLRAAFSYHPPYYHFGREATNYVDYGVQNSRGFRALKVWLALRQIGRSGYVRMIGDDVRLSRRLFERVAEHAELEAATQELSITTFRFVPRALRGRLGEGDVAAYLDRLNMALLERLQSGGETFVSNAVVQGRSLLRACVVNFNTEMQDIDAMPEIVARVGREVDAEMRPAGLTSRA